MPADSMSAYLPTSLLHMIMVINCLESAKRGVINDSCEAKQTELFPYIRDVSFERSLRKVVPGRLSRKCGVDEFIQALAHCDAEARLLQLDPKSKLPLWILVAFANSREWGLGLTIDQGFVGVMPDWRGLSERDREKSKGKKSWDIAYLRHSATDGYEPRALDAVLNGLRAALWETRELAEQLDRDHFVDTLDRARSVLENDGPLTGYAGLLLSEHCFREESRVLFEAAAASWVFGGMGSWTDYVVDDLDQRISFERVTGRLLVAVRNAIAWAVNDGRIISMGGS